MSRTSSTIAVIAAVAVMPWAVTLGACGGGTGSAALGHDVASLRLGVEVDTEAATVEANLVSRGFVVGTTAEGEGYRAFDAAHPDGRSLVRVVTRVGIAIALDVAAAERDDAVRLAEVLGIPDLVVTRVDTARGRECSALLRVAPDGRVSPVPIDLERFGARACIEDIRDIDRNGQPELLTRRHAGRVFGDGVPWVPGVLAVRYGEYGPPAEADFEEFWAGEEGRRQAAAAEARLALDFPRAVYLAVELALVAGERGGSMVDQVRAFDGALAGLVLSAEEAEEVREARRYVADGWRD